MEAVKKIYKEFLAHSEQERLSISRHAVIEVLSFLNDAGLDKEAGMGFINCAMGLFISADRKVSDGETKLYNAIFGTGFSANDLAVLFETCVGEEYLHLLDETIDAMPLEIKNNVCLIGLEILTADGEISDKELEVFERILA